MIEAEKWNFSALLASAKASPVQGEVGCFSNPEGLLQTSGLDKNFQVGDKLDNPSDGFAASSQRNPVRISRHWGASEARHIHLT